MMVTLDVWKSIGINMVYCLSALQSIPEDIYESAEIDGAILEYYRAHAQTYTDLYIYAYGYCRL